MAKKRSTYTNPNFKGFVNYQLSDADRKAVKAKPFTDEDFAHWLTQMTLNGYKATFNYDDQRNTYQCTITPRDEKHENFGFFLVGRGSTALKSFKQAIWVHTEVCAENWGSFVMPQTADDYDD